MTGSRLLIAALLLAGELAAMNVGAAAGANIYTDPEGWRARLGDLDPDRVKWIVETADESPCGPGSAETMKIIEGDPRGFWLLCDVKGLEGRAIEVWRMTRARVRLAGGVVLNSSRIIAAVDPCGRQIIDNARAPFLITENVHGYEGAVRLYIRFDRPFRTDEIESWRPVGARLKSVPDRSPSWTDPQTARPTGEGDK
jgi:hypothetical protein